MSDQHVTIDDEEMELIEKYEEIFGCVPPVAFLDPQTSKKMILWVQTALFARLMLTKIGNKTWHDDGWQVYYI